MRSAVRGGVQTKPSPPLATGRAGSAKTRTVRDAPRPPASRPEPPAPAVLSLIGGFSLRCDGIAVDLPLSAQRLLAFLALQDRALVRAYVAGALWLDAREEKASARLRSTVWRLGLSGHPLLDGSRTHLRLATGVTVDWRFLTSRYRRLLDESAALPPEFLSTVPVAGDLLPDWYDDWVIMERERFRQLRLHALETLCVRLSEAGRSWLAVEAGLAAVEAEPLRESAHRALIAAHLGEGNRSEALRQFGLYRRLLGEELGIEPSQSLAQLVNR